MKPRQFPLLVEEGAVHQIQKPNCAGPEHVVFLQENVLGSALALKTIPGEAVDFAAAALCETPTLFWTSRLLPNELSGDPSELSRTRAKSS